MNIPVVPDAMAAREDTMASDLEKYIVYGKKWADANFKNNVRIWRRTATSVYV